MDANADGGGENKNHERIDWTTDDKDGIFDDASSSSVMEARFFDQQAGNMEAGPSMAASISNKVHQFMQMGFSKEMVIQAIEKNGEDEVLDALLAHTDASGDGGGKNHESIDWTTDDEDEIFNDAPPSLVMEPRFFNQQAGNMEAGPSMAPSISNRVHQFTQMGFSKEMVIQAIEKNGEDEVLDALLAYTAPCPVEFDSKSPYNHSCVENCPEIDEVTSELFGNDNLLLLLTDMDYTTEEALAAIENCGLTAQVAELVDYICAARINSELFGQPTGPSQRMKTGFLVSEKKRKLPVDRKKMAIHLPNPMTGFGIPDQPWQTSLRRLPEVVSGPPYFYYENVALTPEGAWDEMSNCLYGIVPEFVDSAYFCGATRKRGYIHNLPICDRFPLLPRPPLTIQEALPSTKRWWPSWDARTKLNCLVTVVASAKVTERIKAKLANCDGDPPEDVQRDVLKECRQWNLIWVGRNKVAPLEPDEMEVLLGYPQNHTRGGGISRTERYKALGNSFQVDTVAYHLSVLKDQFRHGINVLSLFSGIGGGEVALHRLGIPLKNVVSVEISKVNSSIIRDWWKQTDQNGRLIEISDIEEINGAHVKAWIRSFGGFDLVIGGSPCNNLAGGNRVSRDGLEGKHSSLFYQYCRILQLVSSMMSDSC